MDRTMMKQFAGDEVAEKPQGRLEMRSMIQRVILAEHKKIVADNDQVPSEKKIIIRRARTEVLGLPCHQPRAERTHGNGNRASASHGRMSDRSRKSPGALGSSLTITAGRRHGGSRPNRKSPTAPSPRACTS